VYVWRTRPGWIVLLPLGESAASETRNFLGSGVIEREGARHHCFRREVQHNSESKWRRRVSTGRRGYDKQFGLPRVVQTGWTKERGARLDHKRLFYCVNVNRSSLDHLLLGGSADIDEMSNGPSITPDERQAACISVLVLTQAFWSPIMDLVLAGWDD